MAKALAKALRLTRRLPHAPAEEKVARHVCFWPNSPWSEHVLL